MGKYRIKEPVVYVKGNKVIRHTKPADLVQLDDEVAAELGDKVEARGQAAEQPAEESAEAEQSPAEVAAEAPEATPAKSARERRSAG